MGFDYSTNVTAIKTILENSNTTTSNYDLSSGLPIRIQTIEINDPEIRSIQKNFYPAIFIRINTKDEDFSSLGDTGLNKQSKFAEVSYDIIGLVHKEGGYTTHSGLLDDTYILARNIEYSLQNNITLGNTAMYSNPVHSEFLGPFVGEGAWVKGVMIELKARYFFR